MEYDIAIFFDHSEEQIEEYGYEIPSTFREVPLSPNELGASKKDLLSKISIHNKHVSKNIRGILIRRPEYNPISSAGKYTILYYRDEDETEPGDFKVEHRFMRGIPLLKKN